MPATITKETDRAYELRQKRAKAEDVKRELCERSEKENRTLTASEKETFEVNDTESRSLAERISTLDRLNAIEQIGDNPTRQSSPLPHEDLGNSGKHRYSILKAVRQAASKGMEPLDGIELEVSQELSRRTKKTTQGFLMPMGSTPRNMRAASRFGRHEQRALDTTSGTGSIKTIYDSEWIELLRNRMVVMAAGAREILDLQGKFAIPRQSAAATGYWLAESGAPTGSNQTLDQVLFTPKTVGAFTDISRRFFELTTLTSGEEFVKEDLTMIIARAIDLAALNGTGASNQPLGILQNTAITTTNTVPLGTNGGVPTLAALIGQETQVTRANADVGDLCYIVNGDGRGTLKSTPKIGSTYPVYLWEYDELNGYPALVTQQLPNNLTKGSGTALSPIIFGNWMDLILAYWSGLDILVDPYTGSSSGTVRIVALQDMDIQVRHPLSFSVIVDMISNQP